MGCLMSYETFFSSTINYEDLSTGEDQLETGDMVLFSSVGFESFEIRLATLSPYTHVGMAVRCDHMEGGCKSRDNLYIWHSPADKIPFARDCLADKIKEGPQLNKLRPVIAHASGDVYIRKLEKVSTTTHESGKALLSLDNEDDIELLLGDLCRTRLINWMRQEAKKKYETSTIELVKSAYDGPWGKNKKNTKEYFCSELVAQTLQEMGLLGKEQPSNEFVPADFSNDMKLKEGYGLSSTVTRISRIVINRRERDN